ncbi:hypothetical protein [Parasphaerochaeta coccoides]|uniref:Adenine specific DNA methylase Mod n=1 Tax=Parasphaerochaeta coccoides (strain ATCC BAA-1237 / DSM 17374 / SPN1) TaxID=760011 RepID=F4GKV1_PARC1|nr:hypothetical protein [Parasphaerochaeta coccoides]AEC01864.1 adenine specific DNA methylase Mod [Parasphaerochaeta coccoides DSM 17374]
MNQYTSEKLNRFINLLGAIFELDKRESDFDRAVKEIVKLNKAKKRMMAKILP